MSTKSEESPRMSRRRRPRTLRPRPRVLIAEDGSIIALGESHPIAGESIAMDERPRADLRGITFDGAVPPADEDADR